MLETESSSKPDGSAGGGPSMAHRRDSYFDRMKDSILLQEDILGLHAKSSDCSKRLRTAQEVYDPPSSELPSTNSPCDCPTAGLTSSG